jgi:hypothetical protein
METHPPQPRLVHPLPPAPDFLGREAELARLHSFWEAGGRGVLALVGLGGAGKTALAARFLGELLGPGGARRPGGLFVWSFYQEPDAGLFLREVYDYFTGGPGAGPARGAGLLHLLGDALEAGGPHLLVLDGLERVQRQAGAGGGFGQVEDPLLKGLLLRVAEGLGRTAALVTSRFPLADLARQEGRGYRHLPVGEMDRDAALALLRRRGVGGDDAALAALVESYGAHALTLDHLGSLIGQFLGGDPARAPEAPALAAGVGLPGGDRQALRLARLLAAYEAHLPPAELALLCRLCLLRRSVSEDQLLALFLCSPPVHARTVREAADAVALLGGADQRRGEGAGDLARCVREALEEALAAAPLAGPEEAFRREVRAAAEQARELAGQGLHVDVDELARLYAAAGPAAPTEQRPLPAEDRGRLRALYARYRELRNHPLLPFKEPDPVLNAAFVDMGWLGPERRATADLDPVDVLRAFLRVRGQLDALAYRHVTLQRVRRLCRLRQRQWALAGPLAGLGAGELRQVLGGLVGRHLVLREADGAFTAHPAVRDHFARLGSAAERGQWHDLLREQLVSLVQRPGLRHPEDRVTLDLVEEAVHHATQAGRPDQALGLYRDVLGGLRHLGWKLGEMARGLRILRGFDPCPDRWALGWFLRALGELDEAYGHNDLPYFRADLRLLQGRLPAVAREGEGTRAAAAAFLMGQTEEPPPSVLGCAVPRARALLYLGRFGEARRVARLSPLYHDLGWEGDRARCLVLAAEAARRQGDAGGCRSHLEAAAGWVLHAGSVEHLCLWHLVRARAALDAGDGEAAQRAVNEGLRLARPCGLGLDHVELLCAHAEVILARGDAPAAERMAGEALWRAAAADCRFAWGEAEARHLVGLALAGQRRTRAARAALEAALVLRRRIGDPRAAETERALPLVAG